MTKTEKLLYGGFAIVAIAGIVAMLVSIFSPPKQIVEETAKTPEATVEKQSAKQIEEGPDQMEQWQRNVEAARMQREANEELAKWIQAEEDAERAALEELDKARKEWWESRKGWVENFPFEPTFHPEIRYDPYAYGDDQMRRLVKNHGFLRHFYASYLPYTEEFEQMYNIIKEEFGETDNTIALGWTFNTLKKYHQAAQRDPEEIYMENVRVENERSLPEPVIISADDLGEEFQDLPVEEQNMLVRELAKDYMKEHMEAYQAFGMPSYEVRDITWGEETENLKECILGALISNDANPDQPWMSEEQARAIQERLVNEIPAAGFLEMGEKERLCYVSTYESELKPGDPMLVK